MRCPRCRNRPNARRWWRLPQHFSCDSCGAKLQRSGRLSFSESILIWLLIMLPGTMVAWFGGIAGFLLAGVLAIVIFPSRPWNGLAYELEEDDALLPLAVARTPPLLGPGEDKKPVRGEVSG